VSSVWHSKQDYYNEFESKQLHMRVYEITMLVVRLEVVQVFDITCLLLTK